MRALPSSTALALGTMGFLALGVVGLAPGPAPPPPPASLATRVEALEAGGARPWYDAGPRARFLEAMGLLSQVERELTDLSAPLGDAWRDGLGAAQQSRAAALGGWMTRLQAVLAAEPDATWQAQRRSSAAWTRPALPRRVVAPVAVGAALRLVDPDGSTQGVQEAAWVGGGHVLLLGQGGAWLGGVGRPLRRLALPAAVTGPLALVGTYAQAPGEVAVQAQDQLILLRLDGPGGPRALGTVPVEGPCGVGGLQLERLDEPETSETRLELLWECGGASRVDREVWPLRRGRYQPPAGARRHGFRVVLRG